MSLLTRFVGAYPAQPATAFWRAIEIGVLAEVGLPEGRGLDLGCGDGKLTSIVLSLTGPRTLVGVDPDPLETDAAKAFPFYEAVHTAMGDAVPEPSESFDFVLSNSVLEHIPELDGVMAETARLLRPGGRFLFTVPGPGFHDNLKGSVLPWTSRESYLEGLDRRLAHYRYLSPEGWSSLCGRNGLTVERCRGYLDKAQTQRWETLSRMTGGLLHAVAGERLRPIEIQRRLGARQLQNRGDLPGPLAKVLAGAISVGREIDETDLWREIDSASCLLVEGRRT